VAITQDPARRLGSGSDVGLSVQLDPVIPSLPTARLAVGMSRRLRPALWFAT
jgi:hypothetical protein